MMKIKMKIYRLTRRRIFPALFFCKKSHVSVDVKILHIKCILTMKGENNMKMYVPFAYEKYGRIEVDADSKEKALKKSRRVVRPYERI